MDKISGILETLEAQTWRVSHAERSKLTQALESVETWIALQAHAQKKKEQREAQEERERAAAQERARLQAEIQAMTAERAAPVDILERDERGRISKLRKGSRELIVERGPDGKAIRLV